MREWLLGFATWFSGWRADVWMRREEFFAAKLPPALAARFLRRSPGADEAGAAEEGAWAPQPQRTLPDRQTAGGARPPCAFSGDRR